MIVHFAARSAHSFGGNTTFSLIGNYLAVGLGNYGSAIRQLEMTACFRGLRREGHSSLQRSFNEYHATFLPSLPTVKFLRKKGCIVIQYETTLADATFLERFGFLSAEVFRTAIDEVAQKLHLIDQRLKKTDDFNLRRFHDDVARLVAESPISDEELRAVNARVDQEAKDRLAAMDPWERLDIDWDDYHPAARTLLNDPFFWSQSDDHSPHGNDTGADMLSDFKKWHRRHPDKQAHEMASAILRAWDITQIDYEAIDEDKVKAILASHPNAVSVTDDALIAVAFAAIKLRGCCDATTRDFALAAIKREQMPAVIHDRSWKLPAERSKMFDLLRAALSAAPTVRKE